MTSNVGARMITDKKTLGFTNGAEASQREYENIKKDVMAELKKEFRPEFINRIDEIIVFHKLQEDEIKQIITIMLGQVQKRLESQQYMVEFDDSVKELVAKEGIDTNFGARPLRRTIQSKVEDKIAEAILDGKMKQGSKIVIDEAFLNS